MTTTTVTKEESGDAGFRTTTLAVDFTEEEEEEKRWRKATTTTRKLCIFFGRRDDANDDDEVVKVVKMCGGDSKRERDNTYYYAWKGKSPLRDASSLKHFAEILLGEDQKQYSTIALLCGGVGCQGAKMMRAFQLFLGLAASKRRGARTITMSIERKNIVPAQRTNGNRHDWLRVKHTNGSFEWGSGIIEDAERWQREVRRLAKTIAGSVDGITFREDEETMTMTCTSSSSSQLKDEEECFRFPSVQLRIKEQLREVSDDIAKLFREKRERYRNDAFIVVESTRERYEGFKKWHYVESLPTMHGVYLEVVKANDDENLIIGYASFHTEQAPPQFENVVDTLNASKVQRFCVVNRLVVNPKFRGKGVKELLLRAGCDLYHMKGIPCRITTSAYSAKVSLDMCGLLAFERFKSMKDTGKERSSGKRKIIVNVPPAQKSDDENSDVFESKKEVKRDILRTLNALTPDSSAKLTPKLRQTFDVLSEDDKTSVSGYIISLARLAPQYRKLLADAVLGTRLESIVRKDAQKEIEKLLSTSSYFLSEEEVSARMRFLNSFVDEMNFKKGSTRYLGAKDSALAMTRQDVFTSAKQDMKTLRIVDEDSSDSINNNANVKRGQRSGWSYVYIGTPFTRRYDGHKFTFDTETNRFCSITESN
jgi:GNAT superfamily N-acetyltransferase